MAARPIPPFLACQPSSCTSWLSLLAFRSFVPSLLRFLSSLSLPYPLLLVPACRCPLAVSYTHLTLPPIYSV